MTTKADVDDDSVEKPFLPTTKTAHAVEESCFSTNGPPWPEWHLDRAKYLCLGIFYCVSPIDGYRKLNSYFWAESTRKTVKVYVLTCMTPNRYCKWPQFYKHLFTKTNVNTYNIELNTLSTANKTQLKEKALMKDNRKAPHSAISKDLLLPWVSDI